MPVDRGPAPRDRTGNEITYPGAKGHQKAKAELLNRLDCYCSYCERPGDQAVEHIVPKDVYPTVRHLWVNYLLGCVNCNSTKGMKDVISEPCLFPDEHNTAWAFLYGPGAVIVVNPALSAEAKQWAQSTINLVGLDRNLPPDPRARDRRWVLRDSAWREAEDALRDLMGNDTPEARRLLICSAQGRGFFSVWWTVFGQDADTARRREMRIKLIEAFRGTRRRCFDTNGDVIPDLRL